MFTVSLSQGSDLWKDGDRFKKFANASLELSKVYMELSFRTNSRRELLAAEMHLKNTVRQVRSCFTFPVLISRPVNFLAIHIFKSWMLYVVVSTMPLYIWYLMYLQMKSICVIFRQRFFQITKNLRISRIASSLFKLNCKTVWGLLHKPLFWLMGSLTSFQNEEKHFCVQLVAPWVVVVWGCFYLM